MTLAAILSQVKTIALTLSSSAGTLNASNCMVDDWTALDAPGTLIACVIQQADASRYGPEAATAWAGTYGEHGGEAALHTVSLTGAVKRGQGRGGDAAALATLHTLCDDLEILMRGEFDLAGLSGIIGAQVVSISRPGQLVRPPGQAGQQPIGASVGKVITLQVLEEASL